MSTLPKTFLTPEEYLAIERKAEYKSEYYKGEMFAMSGASRKHSRLNFELNTLIGAHLRTRPCKGYTSDMRVLVEQYGLYTYPDLTIVCGEPRFQDNEFDTLLNPSLLIEILSPSTSTYDRVQKLRWYRSIPSLKEYLLLSQDESDVTLYRRQDEDTWCIRDASGLDAAVELASIEFTLRLRDVYEGILP